MWVSNSAPSGVPSGALFNPYVEYSADTPANGAVSRVRFATLDQNGNTTLLAEWDWVAHGAVSPDSNNIVTGCPGCGSSARTTTAGYTATQAYWTHFTQGSATDLRSPSTIQTGILKATYTFDNPLSTANLKQLALTDTSTMPNPTITRKWTYLSNGNVQSITGPNNITTQINYANTGCPNLYPSSSPGAVDDTRAGEEERSGEAAAWI